MGRIPEYRREVFASKYNPDAINEAGQLARTFGQAAASISDSYDRWQMAKAKDYQATAGIEMENEALQLFEEHKKKYATDPENRFSDPDDGLEQKLLKLKEKYSQNAPNGFASKNMNLMGDQLTATLKGNTQRWEKEQMVRNIGTNTANNLDIINTQAMRVGDPEQLEKLYNKGGPALDALKQVASKEIYDETVMKYRKNLTMSSFEGLINKGEYERAEALLNSQKYDNDLGAGGINRINDMLTRAKEARAKKAADLEVMKRLDPWKYVKKVGENVSLFEMQNGENAFLTRIKEIDDLKAKHNIDLPFFSEDEKKIFEMTWEKSKPSERLSYIEQINQAPVERNKLLKELNIPPTVGLYEYMGDPQDKELLITAATTKPKPPPEFDIKTTASNAENSDVIQSLRAAQTNMPQSEIYKNSVDQMVETMKNVSIIKNDPEAGPKFFKKNYEVINSGSINGFVPKGKDPDQIEELAINIKNAIIERNKTGNKYFDIEAKQSIENDAIWINGNNGLVLINKKTGLAYPDQDAFISFKELQQDPGFFSRATKKLNRGIKANRTSMVEQSGDRDLNNILESKGIN